MVTPPHQSPVQSQTKPAPAPPRPSTHAEPGLVTGVWPPQTEYWTFGQCWTVLAVIGVIGFIPNYSSSSTWSSSNRAEDASTALDTGHCVSRQIEIRTQYTLYTIHCPPTRRLITLPVWRLLHCASILLINLHTRYPQYTYWDIYSVDTLILH